MYILKPYDDALRKIYNEGFDIEGDRTGKGTRCLFGISTEYDVSTYVPLLVYRKAFWKSLVKEFLWYLSGSHMITDLEAMGSGIWSAWKNDEFTKKHGLPQGSGGYIYGFNLINFGADINDFDNYNRVKDDWDGKGEYFDWVQNLDYLYPNSHGTNQLDIVINKLKILQERPPSMFYFLATRY